jgi:DNA-3-methyladenine glycosylase
VGRRLTGAGSPLPSEFYARDPGAVARDLLGMHLTDGVVTVRLVELEAYRGTDDPASHSFRGRTPRTEVMWGPPGRLYVYFTYGMHWCMNVSCGPEGVASAVLLRAGEVLDVGGSLSEAEQRRPGVRPLDRARGPARLARLMQMDGSGNGLDVTLGRPPLTVLSADPVPDEFVRTGPRVGLNPRMGEAAHWPWRYWDARSRAVSPFRPGGLRGRQARSKA